MSCGSYTSPSGKHKWTQGGKYTDTLTNKAGCDSFIIIDLTVVYIDDGVDVSGLTLEAKEDDAGYQWIFCNSGLPIAGATKRQYSATSSGVYAVIIDKNGCKDTSDCHSVFPAWAPHFAKESGLSIFPNPTRGNLVVQAPADFDVESIQVINSLGEVCQNSIVGITEKHFEIDIRGGSGIYTIELASTSGVLFRQLILKQ